MRSKRVALAVFGFIVVLTSCGGNTCELVALRVTPTTATANHLAVPPNNQVRFAANGDYRGSCVLPTCVDCLPGVTWSVSDPANVSLAPSQSGISAIVATCVGQTNGTVTLTATATGTTSQKAVTGTATLTCQ